MYCDIPPALLYHLGRLVCHVYVLPRVQSEIAFVHISHCLRGIEKANSVRTRLHDTTLITLSKRLDENEIAIHKTSYR